MNFSNREKIRGFTLIELLVVIGITAVLATVTVVVINPAELLKQARDSSRLTDIDAINKAIALTLTDNLPLGTANTIYISLPDTSPTCASLGLPAAPIGWNYACVTAANLKRNNGTGWIPINLTAASTGSTLGTLPTDPVNATSSNLYYSYRTDGVGMWNIKAQSLESAKQIAVRPNGFSLGPLAINDSYAVTQSTLADFSGGTNASTTVSGSGISLGVAALAGSSVAYGVGSNPYGIAFDPVTNSVWVTNLLSNTVSKVNITTGASVAYPVGTIPYGVAFDSVTNSVWVANNSAASVSKVNINTGASVAYGVGGLPMGVAFDSVTNSVWVANSNSNTVSKVNINTGASVAYGAGSYPGSVAFDPVTNSAWVTNSTYVAKVNINTGASVAYGAGANPTGVAFDPVTNSVWVTNYGANTVSKVNITTGALVAYAVGTTPYGAAFDPVTNSVWVANYGANTVSKVNITTGTSVAYAVGASPYNVAFDPVTNSVWVANYGANSVSKVAATDQFAPLGVFTSSPMSLGVNASSWGILSWTNSGTQTITMKARSGTNVSMSGADSWAGCASIVNGGSLADNSCMHAGASYIQYQATLSTVNSIQSPLLSSVTATYSR